MTHFPVSNSNLSAAHLAVFLEEKYALQQVTCRILKTGINDTYLVSSASGKAVFRVYNLNWRTETEINEEIRLLQILQQHQISISYPIADRDGQYIHTLNAPEGDRFAVLFSHAAGEKIHSYAAETHFRIGELMGRIHQVTEGKTVNRITYTLEVLLVHPLQEIAAFLPETTAEMQFLRSAQSRLLDLFETANAQNLRCGIVHMDIWFDNLNIAPNNTITLFDFDFCGNGWLALDVAYYVMQLHNIEKYDADKYQPKIDSFLEGYQSIIPITDAEKRLLPALGVSLYIFYLGIQCRRYDNWSNTFLSEDYLKRFTNGIIRRYYEIYKLEEF